MFVFCFISRSQAFLSSDKLQFSAALQSRLGSAQKHNWLSPPQSDQHFAMDTNFNKDVITTIVVLSSILQINGAAIDFLKGSEGSWHISTLFWKHGPQEELSFRVMIKLLKADKCGAYKDFKNIQ